MELSIPDNVWQASVQAAVDNWFAEHPPTPEPTPPDPILPWGMAVNFPADYTATVAVTGNTEPWYFGRGAGDDFNDPNGEAWESPVQPATVKGGTLNNLRTDRQVNLYARTDSGKRVDKQVQVPGATKPSTPPTPTGTIGLVGVFSYDQKPATANSIASQLALPTPTAQYPRLNVLHLDHSGDWNKLASVWFASDWRNAGAQNRLVITVPPWPTPLGNQYAAAARGDFDGNWRTVLQNIASAFSTGSVNDQLWLRFAHEPNCCYVWSAQNNVTEYKQMWHRWSPIARSVSPRFKLIYCPFYGAGKVGFDVLAPDPADYDRTGIDYYGFKNWANEKDMKYGFRWYADWSKNVAKKPGGVYEGNPATYPQVPAQSMPTGSSDDDGWMQFVFDTCKQYGLDYVSYCDTNNDVRSYLPDASTWPKSLAKFKATFAASVPH